MFSKVNIVEVLIGVALFAIAMGMVMKVSEVTHHYRQSALGFHKSEIVRGAVDDDKGTAYVPEGGQLEEKIKSLLANNRQLVSVIKVSEDYVKVTYTISTPSTTDKKAEVGSTETSTVTTRTAKSDF